MRAAAAVGGEVCFGDVAGCGNDSVKLSRGRCHAGVIPVSVVFGTPQGLASARSARCFCKRLAMGGKVANVSPPEMTAPTTGMVYAAPLAKLCFVMRKSRLAATFLGLNAKKCVPNPVYLHL